MKYKFALTLPSRNDGEIFQGERSRGYCENGEIHINDAINHYVYANGEWYVNGYACGKGAAPVLSIENLVISDESYWHKMIYIPEEEVGNA